MSCIVFQFTSPCNAEASSDLFSPLRSPCEIIDAPPDKRLQEFLERVKLCEKVYDFSNPRSQFTLKETKRRYLVDIADYVSNHKGVFNNKTFVPFMHMISANIFRALPVGNNCDHFYEAEEGEPFYEPAWPHLQIVYELLRKFVVSNDTDSPPARACISIEFVTAIVDLFNSEDVREREYLKTILHRIYGKVMPLRLPIRKAVLNLFHRVVYENQRHNGIAELLEILGSIINGFAIPLKDEHKDLLRTGLLPLHIPSGMPSYHIELSFCISQFVKKEPVLTNEVVLCLIKHWPGRNTRKEIMLLNEIEEVLELSRPEDLGGVVLPVFRKVCRCIESPHFQVAERALFYCNNEFIINLLMMYRKDVMPIVVASLQRNLTKHWNANVVSLTCNVQRLLEEMDSRLYENSFRRYEAGVRDEGRIQAERARRWRAVYRMAQTRGNLKKVKSGDRPKGYGGGEGGIAANGITNAWGHSLEAGNKIDSELGNPGEGVVQMIEVSRQAKT